VYITKDRPKTVLGSVSICAIHRLSGIPTHVVVPSVSLAAVVQGLAGTVLVDTPSSAGTERPVRDCGVGATWPAGKAPVLPPITPPEVGGLAAGDVGAACFWEAADPDPAGEDALLPGAPPPTAPAGAPPPTAPAGAPPPTAFPPPTADVPIPPWPPPAPAAPAPAAPDPPPAPPPPWASAAPIGRISKRAIAVVELRGMGNSIEASASTAAACACSCGPST
jgi:hypothetical protein